MADGKAPTAAVLGGLITDLFAGFLAQSISVAARLGFADALVDGPLGIDELAARTGVLSEPAYRILRLLASNGIFTEVADRTFANTERSEALRDVPGSARHMAVYWGEIVSPAIVELLHTVRTGEPGFEKVFGSGFWDWFAEHPEMSRHFDLAMANVAPFRRAVLESYDWNGVGVVADIGGGNGTTLAGILARNPGLRGILVDQQHVVEGAGAVLEAAGVGDRCEVAPGSFFDPLPAADAYVLGAILHDWDDERCRVILGRCREAVRPGGRLVVLDFVVRRGDEPDFAKVMDLAMLVQISGRERTESEWRSLLGSCGWTVSAVVQSLVAGLVEARPS